MFSVLFFLIIAGALGLLFLNLFFRAKVLGIYKYLVQNKIEFGVRHFLNDDLMREEVLTRYPEHEEQIRTFVRLIRRSVTIASAIIVFIFGLGYLLLKFR